MSDSGFREIQLSGKQVVFLFIASVVLLVGAFLLGVRTGRGAVPDETMAQAAPASTETPSADPSRELPPATTPAPGELKYHETLQGKIDARGLLSPTPSATPPVIAPPPAVTTPAPTATPTPVPAKPAPTAKPASPETKPPSTAKPASATAVWSVQVGAFATMENAQRELARVKDKGFSGGSIVDARGTGARYRVRIGPMERAAAETLRARLLKEGITSSLVSR